MTISTGSRVGVYQITALLGRGGMGEVYLARDTRLQRDVALKVLPAGFAADTDRLARFQREAQILASLNHPNIAHIHAVEDSGESPCIVMEMVPGETLHERLQRGPLPVAQALPIGAQIAAALEAAHERGIVHRDLKPANIKVLPDGTVKVLDFGLAKPAGSDAGADLANSPTLLMTGTNSGIILGTAGYMSPEQARGESVDHRTDIFAFGCVLYEMLAGRRAFEGKTRPDAIASILAREPETSHLPADLPPRVRRILARCFDKDIRRRWQAIGDVRYELENDREESALPNTRRSGSLPWVAAAAATLALAAVAWIHFREQPAAQPEMRLEITTPPTSAPFEFALSPDGKYIAFVASSGGSQRIWLRELDKTEVQPLPDTEGGDYPFWSPDSHSIAFYAGGKLKRIDIAGGAPLNLAGSAAAFGGSWNADGDIVFTASSGPLSRIKATGGTASTVTHLTPPNQVQHRYPQFLPDGRHFLFFVIGMPETTGIYAGSLDGGDPKMITLADSAGSLLAPGTIVFGRGTSLLAQHLDLKTLALTGEPTRIGAFTPSSFGGLGGASISADGRIAYRVGSDAPRRLKWLDRNGKDAGYVGEPDPAVLLYPELSPDGRQVAIDRSPQINSDIWVVDVAHGNLTRLTFDPAIELGPIWSNDGRIAYSSTKKGEYNIYAKPSNGAGAEEALLEGPNNKYAQDWSKDGKYLLYSELDSKQVRSLWALPMTGADRMKIKVAAGSADSYNGQFSLDGHWVAYQTNEPGDFQIVVQTFPQPTGKWQISVGGGIQPRWSADGKELYFLAPDGKLMAVTVTTSGSSFSSATMAPGSA